MSSSLLWSLEGVSLAAFLSKLLKQSRRTVSFQNIFSFYFLIQLFQVPLQFKGQVPPLPLLCFSPRLLQFSLILQNIVSWMRCVADLVLFLTSFLGCLNCVIIFFFCSLLSNPILILIDFYNAIFRLFANRCQHFP